MKKLLTLSAADALHGLFNAALTPWLASVGLVMLSAWAGFQMGAPARQTIWPGASGNADPRVTSSIAASEVPPSHKGALSIPASSSTESVAAKPSRSEALSSVSAPASLRAAESLMTPPSRADGVVRQTVRAARLAAAPVNVPLAFRPVDPVALGLTSSQVAMVEEVRGKFTQQVGQQNPADPAYRARWISAQALADQMLRAKLGWTMFNQFQIQATQSQVQ